MTFTLLNNCEKNTIFKKGLIMNKTVIIKILIFLTPILGFSCVTTETPTKAAAVTVDKIAKKDVLTADKLKSWFIKDEEKKLSFTVIYDEDTKAIAQSHIATLRDMYFELTQIVGIKPELIKWNDVYFTKNIKYIPQRSKNITTRWPIEVAESGKLEKNGLYDLYIVIPHEQVHNLQSYKKGQRWFSEGTAEWIGGKVSSKWYNEGYKNSRKKHAEEYQADPNVYLGNWGGLRIKREAIMRQMPDEEKKKMQKNPNYSPDIFGSFQFSPDDMEPDEVKQRSRYYASHQIFLDLEKQFGTEKIIALFNKTLEKEQWNNESLIQLFKDDLGVDISKKLE